jgi:hypothetical protein
MIETPADYRSFAFLREAKSGLFSAKADRVSGVLLLSLRAFNRSNLILHFIFFGRVLSGQAIRCIFCFSRSKKRDTQKDAAPILHANQQ